MPNWTSNIIRAEGPGAALRAFIAQMRIGDEPFDFNALIPMPQLLRHTGSGGNTIDGQRVSSWYVIDPKKSASGRKPGDPPNERLFTPEEEAALRDIGHSNWYDWSVANWGTKWNACDVRIDDGTLADGIVKIHLNTAWCAPVPIFEALLARFPDLSFEFRWTDEDDADKETIWTARAGERP